MAIMYLSKKKFACPIVQISIYHSELKQFTFYTFENGMKPDINSLVNIVDQDQLATEYPDPHCFQCNM